ncbi:MAG: hypothetical protein KJ893_09345 [Candidatus Omnitrophica bacterium]|nr:hypothetical protein [Candidatus Omnitrophota bacterium]
MSNYLHGIIIIKNPVGTAPTKEGCVAGTALSANKNTKNNLPIVIGSFKSAVTKQIKKPVEKQGVFVYTAAIGRIFHAYHEISGLK